MNTPISPETAEMIEKEAEALKRKMPDNYFPTNYKYYEGYKAGATAYAPYKEQFEQAKKALEEIVTIHAQYKDAGIEHPSTNHLRNIALQTLATWKEEGGSNG